MDLELAWRCHPYAIGNRSLFTFCRQAGLHPKYLMQTSVISFTTVFRGEKAHNGSWFSYKLRWSRSEGGQNKNGPEIRHGGKTALFSWRWFFPDSWDYWHFLSFASCFWSLRSHAGFPTQSNSSAGFPTQSNSSAASVARREMQSWDRVTGVVNKWFPKTPLMPKMQSFSFFTDAINFPKVSLNSAVVWTLYGSQVSKQNRKLDFFCLFFSLFCFFFAQLFQWLLKWYYLITCGEIHPIAIFGYFTKTRQFGNVVYGFKYPFLNLDLVCVHYIALLNVHSLSVFLHYLGIKKSRDQRLLTFLFKQSFLLC